MAASMDKLPTKENLADALYILAQMGGSCGDWGSLPENPDLKKKYEAYADALIFAASGTKFCADFIKLVDRDLGDVDQ